MPYYVYLLASKKHGTLYLGVTRNLVRRVYEHRTKPVESFTSRYGVDKLVWFEIYEEAAAAIAREKELKKWLRDWTPWKKVGERSDMRACGYPNVCEPHRSRRPAYRCAHAGYACYP